MNKIYSKVWNKSLGQLVAASELAHCGAGGATGAASATRGSADARIEGGARRLSVAIRSGLGTTALLVGLGMAVSMPAFAARGIFINDGTDGACLWSYDTAGIGLLGNYGGSNPDPSAANSAPLGDLGASTPLPTTTELGSASSMCTTGDKATQTNRALFYGPASGTGSNSLTLGGELYVNSGNLGVGGGQTGSRAGSMRIGGAATLAGASGVNSIAIGAGTTATQAGGTNAIAIGSGSNASASGALALGGNAAATDADAVALGTGSVTAAAVQTGSTTIGGTTYTFAGATPNSVVSMGAPGAERQVINVAAGQLSADSTDAVNGSQLYATNQAVAAALAAETHDFSVNSVDPTTDTNYDNSGATGVNALAAGVSATAAGESSTAVGASANAVSKQGTAIGASAKAGNTQATAVGAGAYAWTGAAALGYRAVANGSNSVAVGSKSYGGIRGVAVGSGARADGYNSAVLGFHGSASGFSSTALGYGALATGENSIAAGSQASSMANYAAAFGMGAYAAGYSSTALGDTAFAAGTDDVSIGARSHTYDGGAGSNIALGADAYAGSDAGSDIALGNAATASGGYSVALGRDGSATGLQSVALGNAAEASGDHGVALGASALSSGLYGSALGTFAQALGDYSTALGAYAVSTGTGSATLGRSAAAVGDNSLALGAYAAASNAFDVALGAGSVTAAANPTTGTTLRGTTYTFAGGNPQSVVSVGAPGAERQVTNVAAGQLSASSTDAVNGSQLYATNQAIGALGSTANAGWNLSANGGTPVNVAPGSTVDVAQGTNIVVTQDATTGDLTIATADNVAFTSVTTGNTVVDDSGVTVSGGANAPVSLTNAGLDNGGNKITNVAAGTNLTDAVNVSQLNTAVAGATTHYYSVNDDGTQQDNYDNDGATGVNSIAAGVGASASGDGSTAIGTFASAINPGDVALGANSVTAAANPTSGVALYGTSYTFAGGNPLSVVSVGSAGAERQVTNVAAGRLSTSSTDAVNGSQLYATNQAVTAIGTQVITNTGDITNLQSQIDGINHSGGGAFLTSADTSGSPSATGNNSAAGGANASASGDGSLAVGNDSAASGGQSTALGNGAQATGDNSVALGAGSVADADDTVSVGAKGNERRITNVAAGNAPTDAVNVSQLQASQKGSVQYDTNKDGSTNYASVTLNPGGDTPTVIHNVGSGVADNDAVNVGQLNAGIAGAVSTANLYTDQRFNTLKGNIDQVGNRANAGIASAIAAASLPQPYAPNQSSLGVGLGSFRGEAGIAVGLSKITESGRWILKANVNSDTRGDVGAGVGAGIVW